MSSKTQQNSTTRPANTIPELEQSKAAVLNTLTSEHSRRSYKHAIDRFISWYCSEPRLTFNRSVVVSYRSFLERLSLSAATINLHLSAIRRLADESAESGWLSRNWQLESGESKASSGSGGKWATGSRGISPKIWLTPPRKITSGVGEMEQYSDCCWDADCDARKSWV
jgi:Phage integrase, N-terminal SAM-like domain